MAHPVQGPDPAEPPTDDAAAGAAAGELHFVLATVPQQRRIALITAACLGISGIDVLDQGGVLLGIACMAWAAVGLFVAVTSWRVGSFLRWGNLPNAALLLSAASTKFAHGKLALPSLQTAAALAAVALAVFDLPSPGQLVVAGDGIELRLSRRRRLFFHWAELADVAIAGTRVRLSTKNRWSIDVEVATAGEGERLRTVLALRLPPPAGSPPAQSASA